MKGDRRPVCPSHTQIPCSLGSTGVSQHQCRKAGTPLPLSELTGHGHGGVLAVRRAGWIDGAALWRGKASSPQGCHAVGDRALLEPARVSAPVFDTGVTADRRMSSAVTIGAEMLAVCTASVTHQRG